MGWMSGGGPERPLLCELFLAHDTQHIRYWPLLLIAVARPESRLVASGQIEVDACGMNREACLRTSLDMHRGHDRQRELQKEIVKLAHRVRAPGEEKEHAPCRIDGDRG